MAKGLDELLDWLVAETAYSGEIGLSATDFIAAVSRFYAGNQENGSAGKAVKQRTPKLSGDATAPEDEAAETAPDASTAYGSEADLQLARKVWGWLIERSEIRLGRNGAGNSNGTMLSLDDVLAMPEAKPELPAKDADTQPPSTPAPAPGRRRAAPKKGADLPPEQPGTRPRLYASEQVLWFTLTGHDVDYKRLPLLEWKLLLGIASAREKGILQADLRALVNQDKRSVPKRTDFLAQKGYAVKRTTIARGFRTSMLWLTGFAPVELPDAEPSGSGSSAAPAATAAGTKSSSATIDLSPEFLAKDLHPVPWCNRWTGETIEFASFGQTIIAIIKAWGVIRLTDVKQKLGIHGMRWQMKTLAKTCREFSSAGIFRYVAAVRQDERRLFKDCIKFEREPTKEEWDLYLAAGSKRRVAKRDRLEKIRKQKERQGTLEPQNEDYDEDDEDDEGDDEDETSAVVPWSPGMPLINLVSEAVQQAGPEGVTAPQISRALMEDGSFYRYFLSLLADMARDNNQPEHLARYQISGNTDFLRKNRSSRFKPVHPSSQQDLSGGVNCLDGFAPLPEALANQTECGSLSELASHAIVESGPKKRPYHRRQIMGRQQMELVLVDRAPEASVEPAEPAPELELEQAEPGPEPGKEQEAEQELEADAVAEPEIAATVHEKEAAIVDDKMDVDETVGSSILEPEGDGLQLQLEDTPADGEDTENSRMSNPMVRFGKLVPKKKRRGRFRRSLVVCFRMEQLKTAEFLRDDPNAQNQTASAAEDCEHSSQPAGVACRFNGSPGRLAINGDDKTLLFTFEGAAGKEPMAIPVDSIVDAPAIRSAPGGDGQALLLQAKEDSGKQNKRQKRKRESTPTWPYVFILDQDGENQQQATALLDDLVQLRNGNGAEKDKQTNVAEDVSQDAVQAAAPSAEQETIQDDDEEATTARARGRPKKTKAAKATDAQELFVCEQCNGTWKNLGGLQYHQTKARTSCNPNYVPPDTTEIERREREREAERLERLERIRQKQERAANLREEKLRAREIKAKLRQSTRNSGSVRDTLEPSSPISPSSGQQTPLRDFGGASRRLFGLAGRKGHATVPRGLVQNIATAVQDNLQRDQAATSSQVDITNTIRKAVTSAINTIGTQHRGAARFVTGNKSAVGNGSASLKRGRDAAEGEDTAEEAGGPPSKRRKAGECGSEEDNEQQDLAMSAAVRAGPDQEEDQEPNAASSLPQPHYEAPPEPQTNSHAQQAELSTPRHFRMPAAQKSPKTTVFALRTQRTSEIIKHLVDESGGIFPSDRSLWYAVYGLYTKTFPDEDPPTLNITKMTVKKLETAKQMEEHTFGFRDDKGRFLYCRMLIRPGEDPQSEAAKAVKKQIQDHYPEPYVPEAFMPTEAGMALLRAVDKDPPSQQPTTRGRRKLSSNIEVLNAPFYDHAASPLFRRAGRFVVNYPETAADSENKRPVGRPRKYNNEPSQQDPQFTDFVYGSVEDGLGGEASRHHSNPGLDSLPASFYASETRQSGTACVHFLPPNTSLEDEEGSPEAGGDEGSAVGEPSQEHTESYEEESPVVEYRFADETIVLKDSPEESGLWPARLPTFFRKQPEASFAMEGFMPKRKDLVRENLPRSVADCIDMFRGNQKLHTADGTRAGQFFLDVNYCRDWELSRKGTQTLSNDSVAPDYVFLDLEFPGPHEAVDIPNLRWYDNHQYTLDSLPYSAFQMLADGETTPGQGSPQKNRVRAGRGGRGGSSVRGRGNGRSRGQSWSVASTVRINQPHHTSYLLNSRRELTAYPQMSSDYLRRPLDRDVEQAEEDAEEEVAQTGTMGGVDWTADNTKIVTFVIVKTLLGGLTQSIDWGLMMRLFPDMKLLDLRNFWRWVRRERQPYIEKLTEMFQQSFVHAYDTGEVPKLDFDNLLEYDWKALVDWMLRLLERKKYTLPATRAQLDLECTLANPAETISTISSASLRTGMGWREEFFHPTRSVWNRLQDSASEAAAWSVDAPRPAESARKWHQVARSWLRALCATPHYRYKPSVVKQKLLTLGGESEPVISRILQGAIVELQAERVLRRTKSLLAMGGRMYRLTEAYTSTLDKLAQEDKFRQARAFKQKLDRCFRGLAKTDKGERGRSSTDDADVAALTAPAATNPALSYEILRTANDDGMIMALFNLQAHGRVVLEPIDPPSVPFGFEPGNYETRKFPEHYQRFRQRVVPTDRYLFNDDAELAAKLRRTTLAAGLGADDNDSSDRSPVHDSPPMSPPNDTMSPHGEVPVWCDVFGVLERQRFAKMVGSVVFSLATRGATEAHQTAAHLRPVVEAFEVDLIEAWAKSAGILESRETTTSNKGNRSSREASMPPALSEWWWLQVGEMYGDGWGVKDGDDAVREPRKTKRKTKKGTKGKKKASEVDDDDDDDDPNRDENKARDQAVENLEEGGEEAGEDDHNGDAEELQDDNGPSAIQFTPRRHHRMDNWRMICGVD